MNAPRHIFIGDIHGCFDEVDELLRKLRVRSSDVVVSLGDLVRKGPAADRVVDCWSARRYRAVLGNNDAKLVGRAHSLRRLIARRRDRRVMRDSNAVQWLERLPLFADFPDIDVVAVHGGVLPNDARFSAQLVTPDAALELRYVRRDASGTWRQVPKGKQQPGDRFWSEAWDGDRIVVYGHTPRDEPRVDRRAIGLDTGCVYGGRLSAAVFDAAGRWAIEQVRARRRYAS